MKKITRYHIDKFSIDSKYTKGCRRVAERIKAIELLLSNTPKTLYKAVRESETTSWVLRGHLKQLRRLTGSYSNEEAREVILEELGTFYSSNKDYLPIGKMNVDLSK